MADTQLKAKISADTTALNSAIDKSKAKVADLGRSAQANFGQMGGAAAKAGGAVTQAAGALGNLGGKAAVAGQAVAGLGQAMQAAMMGPVGMAAAAATAIMAVVKAVQALQAAQDKQRAAAIQGLREMVDGYAKLARAAAGAAGRRVDSGMGVLGGVLRTMSEGGQLSIDQQVAKEMFLRRLQREDPTALAEYERGGGSEADRLRRAVQMANQSRITSLESGIGKTRSQIGAAEERAMQIYGARSNWASETVREIEAMEASLKALNAELAEAKKLDGMIADMRDEADIRKRLVDGAREAQAAEQAKAKAEADAAQAAKDRAAAQKELENLLGQEAALRKQRLDKLLAEQDRAATAWRSASDRLRGAEQSLADIQRDIAARKTQDRISALDDKLSGYGFALPGKRGKNARLDAGIAAKLAQRAQGEDVDFSRRERRRIRDYQRTTRQRDRLVERQAAEAKRQQDASDRQRLEAARQQLAAAQAQQVAAQRQLQAADALLNAVGGRGAAQRESRRIASEAEAKAARQRENAKADAAQRAYDPNAKPRKTETIRQRRAREARERMAPGVPGAAAGGTGGGAELGVLRGIERGVDRLGDKVFVVV